jgi:hypothetical protein
LEPAAFQFTHRFLAKGDRTVDQMIQAARSGKKNLLEGGTRSDLGDLWRDADSLRRAGANTRSIEYYASDLEQSLRRWPQGAAVLAMR